METPFRAALDQVSQEVNSLNGKFELINSQIESYEKDRESMRSFLLSAEKVRVFINKTIDEQRKMVQDKISALISEGLSTVFEEPIRFLVVQDESGKSDFRLSRFKNNVWVEEPILGSAGGGLINLVSFLLNVVVLLLYRPAKRKVLLLDEVWSNIDSMGRSDKVKDLIENLADKTGIQFIINTHKEGIRDCGDVIYRAFKNSRGETEFERLK